MAEDKLGTLEYDMLINEEKLTKQLQEIDKLLKVQDDKWKKALSSIGSGSVGNIDTSKIIVANKAVMSSTDEIATSIKRLKSELSRNQKAYEELSSAKREEDRISGNQLATIQKQKDQLAELGKTYRQVTAEKRAAAAEEKRIAKEQQSAKESLESQRSQAFVSEQLAAEKALTAEIKKQQTAKEALESQRSKAFVSEQLAIERQLTKEINIQQAAKRSLEAQRSAAFVKGELDKEKEIGRVIKEQESAIKSLNSQRSRALIAINKENEAAKKALDAQRSRALITTQNKQSAYNLQLEKLDAKIAAEKVGTIGRLRAEYAKYAFQLGQVGKALPYSTAKIRELTAAMAANKQQIQALAPTVGLWGKLVSAIRTYATAYLSVQAVIGLGRAVFTQTKELDQLAFSMKTVIQNSTELAKTQKFLSDIAVNYGGDLLTLSERYIKFRAAAIQSNVTAGETQKIFDSVSKAAGTLGLKTDELSGVYLALEQMLSKGKVTTEELRRQLGERLPGAFGIMANALGVTIPELDKMLKKGEVLSTEALPKFAAALEKAYGIESLKKIDTLAAAQGRMSTQFTELIRSVGASDGFKGAINAMADFFGLINRNIGTIGFFAKTILVVVGAMAAWRLEQYLWNRAAALGNAIKASYTSLTVKQTVATIGFQSAAQRAAVAENAAAAATSRWSLAFKTFGGWIGIVVNLIVTAVAYFAIFGRKSSEVTQETLAFTEQLIEAKKNIDNLFEAMGESEAGSNRFENAISKINFQLAKYNLELITSRSTVDELTEAHNRLKEAIIEGMFAKERSSRIDAAEAEYSKVQAEIVTAFADKKLFDPKIQEDAFSFMLDIAENTSLKLEEKVQAIIDEFGIGSVVWIDQLRKLESAAKDFKSSMDDINQTLPEITKPEVLDISGLTDQLKNAKEEFEKVLKIGAENVSELVFFDNDKGIEDYKQYLNDLLVFYEDKAGSVMTFSEFLKLDTTSEDIAIAGSAYRKYVDQTIADDKTRFKAREQILLELSELEKKTTERTGKDPRLVSLEAQLSLLEKMKTKYDELRTVGLSPQLALSEVLDQFGNQMENLKMNITPELDTEGFIVILNQFADAVAQFDKKLADSIREKIPIEATDDIIVRFKKMFADLNDEFEKYKAKDDLRKSIFEITGDTELAIKLTTDEDQVDDIVAYMKSKVEEMGKEAGFDFGFEELVTKLNSGEITGELQSAIEKVLKFVADKEKNILLDALKFIYEGIPEGVDVQFDFSKVIVQLNKSLDDIQKGAQAAIASGVIPEETISKVKQLGIDAVNEVARNAVDKLGANYIKDNLPEQLANDFAHMADASTESIRAIVTEIDGMKDKLRSRDSIESFFDVSGLTGTDIQPIIDQLVNTDSFDDFLAKIKGIREEISNVKEGSKNAVIADTFVSEEDLNLLDLLALALEKLGFNLKGVALDAGNRSLENIAQDAKKLGTEIKGLIDNVESLAESFGFTLSESGKNSLEGIKIASVGITEVISGAALAAQAQIGTLEKASAILTIISAVIQVMSGLARTLTNDRKESEEREQAMIDIAYEYNKALKERNLLLEQAKTIFGTDEYGSAISQVYAMGDAQNDLADSLKRIEAIQVKVRDAANFWEIGKIFKTIFGGYSEFGSILEKWPQLIEGGIFNLELAKEIVSNTSSGLSEEQNKILQEGIDAQERYKDALDSFNDYLSSVFGDLGSNLMTAITENLNSTMDALDIFTDYASSALEKLFSDLAYSMYLAPIFTQLQEQVQNAYTDSIPDDASQILSIFRDFAPLLSDGMEGASDFLKTMQDAAKLQGFDLFDSDTTNQSGISRGIQGVTEDTARRLEGLINSIRETTVQSLGNNKELLYSNQMIQAYSGQSLAKLTNIDNNIALQLSLFNNLMSASGTTGMKGLRVVVQ